MRARAGQGRRRRSEVVAAEHLRVRWLGVTAATTVAVAALLAPPVAACAAPAAGPGRAAVEVEALRVELSAARARYRPGDVVTVTVHVHTGEAKGAPTSGAVTEVTVLSAGRERAKVGGTTDAAGRLVRSFRLARDLPPGRLVAHAAARYQLVAGTDCGGLVNLTGRATADPLATVTR